MRAASILAAAMILTACGEEPAPTFAFTADGFDPADQQALTAAVKSFQEVCPDLFRRYWKDVERAQFQHGDPALNYTGEAYGWVREVWLEVKLADRPKAAPTMAGGHTLHYLFGAGARPGAISKKDVGTVICGWTVHRAGDDVFQPAAGMQVLSKLQS